MTKQPVPMSQDQQILRSASLRVALRVSAACAVLVLCLLTAATVYLLSRTGSLEPVEPGAAYAYLDTKDLIKAMIIAGASGVLLAGVIGWLSARSSIKPLGEALARQRRFVQDASHELRTPLAILDARIQLAQRSTDSDSKTGQALTRIRSDASALSTLVNELLESATGAGLSPDASPTDVGSVAQDVVESIRQLADDQRVTLEISGSGRPLARIDPLRVRRAILSLVENALAHTPAGGRITVATAVEKGQCLITVTDTGHGVSGIGRDRIFERFARASPQSAAPGQRSFGIGLSLVREIAVAAGGTAELAHSGPEGTTMRIRLPFTAE